MFCRGTPILSHGDAQRLPAIPSEDWLSAGCRDTFWGTALCRADFLSGRGAFMLTIFGRPHNKGGFCDGVSRRDFLTVGGTVLGGALALPNLLAAEAQSGIKLSHKAIINVFLPG